MPLPPLSPPPKQMLDPQTGAFTRQGWQWIEMFYRKLGAASDTAPISVTGNSENITGVLASVNLNPGSRQNAVNRATVDSIDAGTTATIRVYGEGGVGTEWPNEVNGVVEGTFPAGTLPGFGYGVTRHIYYSEQSNTFMAFDPTTEFASSLRDEYRWVGSIKTVASGGTGGVTGGGGTTGGSGGVTAWKYRDVE